jgi:hypothetical protein
VLTRLCRENAAIAPPEILRCTQKLLDRVLFCAFCECRGLFRAIDEGNAGLNIPAYNGGLFWQAAFPEVFAQGGFDFIVGNPPYIRQELLSPFKPWLESHYEVFHGMADLYVYFYELGVRMLKPGGLLCFIVTNKGMKAGYPRWPTWWKNSPSQSQPLLSLKPPKPPSAA